MYVGGLNDVGVNPALAFGTVDDVFGEPVPVQVAVAGRAADAVQVPTVGGG